MIEKINELKKKKNAVIIAHLYQQPPIQDIADFVGDSLDLSRRAKDTNADMILFCGVWFMAETAKILSPKKTVLLPEPDAGCPMADMVTVKDVENLRREHPKAAVVCYVNSSADVKAVSDICCTSSNAVKVVRSIKEEEIIFVPDQNLGAYVSRFVPEKRFILHSGFCPTHHRIKPEDVKAARDALPGVPVLVHPECTPEVVALADFAGSTAQIIQETQRSNNEAFIIGTESGVLHRLSLMSPNKKFYTLKASMVCPNMKKTSLGSVLHALENTYYEMKLSEDVISAAAGSLNRMLEIQ
jgi:quinolinate synthase